jgi:hypothetical protein
LQEHAEAVLGAGRNGGIGRAWADCSLRALSLKRRGSRPWAVMRPSLAWEREPSRNRLTSWLAWYWPLAWRHASSALAE